MDFLLKNKKLYQILQKKASGQDIAIVFVAFSFPPAIILIWIS